MPTTCPQSCTTSTCKPTLKLVSQKLLCLLLQTYTFYLLHCYQSSLVTAAGRVFTLRFAQTIPALDTGSPRDCLQLFKAPKRIFGTDFFFTHPIDCPSFSFSFLRPFLQPYFYNSSSPSLLSSSSTATAIFSESGPSPNPHLYIDVLSFVVTYRHVILSAVRLLNILPSQWHDALTTIPALCRRVGVSRFCLWPSRLLGDRPQSGTMRKTSPAGLSYT